MTTATLLLTLLLACGDKDGGDDTGGGDGGGDGGAAGTDADFDGYPTPEDFDDDNAAVHPDATEVCNEQDDDCDGLTDDADDSLDSSTQGTWYTDADGDLYGADGAAVSACSQPIQTATEQGDCDDGDNTVHPGVAEVCNDIDDDCNDQVDDDDPGLDTATASAWYVDADLDGYGADGETVLACDQPADATAKGGDCDDEQATVHPGAEELCDELDNDCNAKTTEDGVVTVGGVNQASLAAAIEAAGEADEILVCPGTYTGPFTTTRKASIRGVGGASVTTLTISRTGTILTAGGDLSVSGLTFSRGAGTYTGGIDAFSAKTPLTITVDSCIFDGNSGAYGGAILAYNDSTLYATDTTFSSNRATASGGAVYANNAVFTGATFTGNTAVYGGAAMLDAGTMTIDRDSLFTGNSATLDATGVGGYGGAILVNGGSLVAESGTEFSSNEAFFGGGVLVFSITDETTGEVVTPGSIEGGQYTSNSAIYSGGGVVLAGPEVTAMDLTCNANSATWGGGMSVESDEAVLEGIEIYDNVATDYGGGLLFPVEASGIVVRDTLLDNNSAPDGGGLALEGGPEVTLESCTISSNVADVDGGGIYLSSSSLTMDGGEVSGNVATGGDGGGAWLWLSSLFSFDVDWAEGETDNSPDDVFVASDTGEAGESYTYGAGETFACDTGGCE